MSSATIKKLDRLFGLYMRRKHTVCKMCGNPLDETAQVSHCHGRANMSVRWDERNCYLVHDSCHRAWETMGRARRNYFLEYWLGRDGAVALALDAASSKKWTADELAMLISKYSI